MVDFLNLRAVNERYRGELEEAFRRVLDRGWYILGEELEAFESEFAAYCGAKYCVGVGNGLDALTLSLRALNIGAGDEVIVPANTFIATALAVTAVGAKIVLAEPSFDSRTLDPQDFARKITAKTKAVMPVHLYGKIADMAAIGEIARETKIAVVEDAAQAHGARDDRGIKAGGFGNAAAGFSFYPGKNLGALGDAGAIVTDDATLADRVRILRGYGARKRYIHDEIGVNSRLDELQAAFLRVKLKFLDADNEARKKIAKFYCENIKSDFVAAPTYCDRDIWHIYAVLTSDRERIVD